MLKFKIDKKRGGREKKLSRSRNKKEIVCPVKAFKIYSSVHSHTLATTKVKGFH